MAFVSNRHRDPGVEFVQPGPGAFAFHRAHPAYEPGALAEIASPRPDLYRLFAKDERNRLGLPAFKILGASWAIESVADPTITELTAATDGNHGRAVARVARDRGLAATIFVPTVIDPEKIEAIASEGATVIQLDDDYDAAVAAAARHGEQPGVLLVQDTAWPGYTDIPSRIVDGYSTIFAELDEQLAEALERPDDHPIIVLAPNGVGSLAQAATVAAQHYGWAVLIVDPTEAACGAESLAAGAPVTVPASETIMAGLNCPTLSSLAWPVLAAGCHGAITVTDDDAREAMRYLADRGIPTGPTGSATTASLPQLPHAFTDGELGKHLAARPGEPVVITLLTEAAY